MFTSTGFLKGSICPYYANGLCERPYCHFRHAKPEVKREDPRSVSVKPIQSYSSSNRGTKPAPGSHSLLNAVGRAIKQVHRDVGSRGSTRPHKYGHRSHGERQIDASCPYRPSRISERKKPVAIEAYSPQRVVLKSPIACATPVYIPTKIDRSKEKFNSTGGFADAATCSDVSKQGQEMLNSGKLEAELNKGSPLAKATEKPLYTPSPIVKAVETKTKEVGVVEKGQASQPVYIPTKFSELSKVKPLSDISGNDTPDNQTGAVSSCVYRPTPISQLSPEKPESLVDNKIHDEYNPQTSFSEKNEVTTRADHGKGKKEPRDDAMWKLIAMTTEAKFSDSDDDQAQSTESCNDDVSKGLVTECSSKEKQINIPSQTELNDCTMPVVEESLANSAPVKNLSEVKNSHTLLEESPSLDKILSSPDSTAFGQWKSMSTKEKSSKSVCSNNASGSKSDSKSHENNLKKSPDCSNSKSKPLALSGEKTGTKTHSPSSHSSKAKSVPPTDEKHAKHPPNSESVKSTFITEHKVSSGIKANSEKDKKRSNHNSSSKTDKELLKKKPDHHSHSTSAGTKLNSDRKSSWKSDRELPKKEHRHSSSSNCSEDKLTKNKLHSKELETSKALDKKELSRREKHDSCSSTSSQNTSTKNKSYSKELEKNSKAVDKVELLRTKKHSSGAKDSVSKLTENELYSKELEKSKTVDKVASHRREKKHSSSSRSSDVKLMKNDSISKDDVESTKNKKHSSTSSKSRSRNELNSNEHTGSSVSKTHGRCNADVKSVEVKSTKSANQPNAKTVNDKVQSIKKEKKSGSSSPPGRQRSSESKSAEKRSMPEVRRNESEARSGNMGYVEVVNRMDNSDSSDELPDVHCGVPVKTASSYCEKLSSCKNNDVDFSSESSSNPEKMPTSERVRRSKLVSFKERCSGNHNSLANENIFSESIKYENADLLRTPMHPRLKLMRSSPSSVYHEHKEKSGSLPFSERKDSLVFNSLFGEDSDSDSIVLVSSGDESSKPKRKPQLRHRKRSASPVSVINLSDSDYDDGTEDSHPLLDGDTTEGDTYEECLQIFNESRKESNLNRQGTDPPLKKFKLDDADSKAKEIVLPGVELKKRTAHQALSSSTGTARRIASRPFSTLTPAQVMHNRMISMQQQSVSNKATPTGNKIGSSLLRKQHDKLIISTLEKGTKRVAHVSTKVASERPTIPAEYGSKVPITVRQTYLNKIIDECLKVYETTDDAYQRALSEEKAAYDRSSSRAVYLNVAINAIKKLRNESDVVLLRMEAPNAKRQRSLSHEAMLGGSKAAKTSFSIERPLSSSRSDEVTESEFIKCMEPYILSDMQLIENGFPRIDPDKTGAAIVHKATKEKKRSDPNEKTCVRCGTRFFVSQKGVYLRIEECTHHWGKCFKRRVNGVMEQRYTCCQEDFSAPGCQVAKCHVYDDNKLDTQIGFVRTLASSPPPGGHYKVYAMDCEMVYTTGGIELARVTVIDFNLQPVYESTVLPSHRIVDCNTRFSGLTEKDFKNVTTKLRDVQAVLLSMFSDKNILIGHSLESDLLSLKMIHSTVVDTSVVFPHRLGAPYKRALKTLMAEYLKKIIQDDVGGHDSHEDAQACMELMKWRVREDRKKLQPRK